MMTTLTISLEFITGRCTATSAYDREKPEWPPHPGRVFMAMAATCFEMGEESDEVAALRWLEALPAPDVLASDHYERTLIKYFVPVNDRLTESKSILQTTPGLTRSKQERHYPTAIPWDPVVTLIWSAIPNVETHFEALSRICSNVIRIGHSSSLVRAWAELTPDDARDESDSLRHRWSPTAGASQWRARVASDGTFERLKLDCNMEQIDLFAELKMQIESSRGKEQKEAKQIFESEFGETFKSSLKAPEPTSPTLGIWQGYQSADVTNEPPIVEGIHFDSELIVLAKSANEEERNFGIEDCLALTSRLREALMSNIDDRNAPIPEWFCGHQSDGSPTQSPHVAFLALPFVGPPSADGHVMGLALALPRQISLEERGALLGPLLFDENADASSVKLNLGKLAGDLTLKMEERAEPPCTLRNSTWTKPSEIWASVTPVVLDKFPKSSKGTDRAEWEAEVRGVIAQSCVQAGLPEPLEIDVDTTSWHVGAPRAVAKTRPLYGKRNEQLRTKMGDGFPLMSSRPGKPSRPQIHVRLRFSSRVQGPVLLGAGRFLGYGLCKPIQKGRKKR